MKRAVICKGDPTTHGGTVIEGFEHATCLGRQIALRGCMTFCPVCHGNFPITEGAPNHTYDGKGMALHGMSTGCGAKLIATQDGMTVDDGSGLSSDNEAGSASSPAAAPEEFGGVFRAVNADTGAPRPHLRYRVDLPGGRSVEGVTDADGKTAMLSAQEMATAQLFWLVDPSDVHAT
jgi:uncharacterized Zn-binding protein involved in type VI secretion